MKYLRPRLPEKEIELCLDLFDKQEAKKRILKYIEGVFDDAESQLKNCFIHDVVLRSEQLKCEHKGRRTATELVEYCEDCKKILFHP